MTVGSDNCWLRGLLFCLLLSALVGCASHSQKFAPIAAELAGHDLDAALLLLDDDPPERDRLLWMLNRGMLLRIKGEFVASNREFAAAKQRVELLNALSLREQASALTINDAMRSYAGAPYEQVLLNIYSALNYLDLGQLDAARVEVLQVDLRLRELADREVGALFENDPFARYLSGMIYEAGGEYSDAMIAYRHAYQAYLQHGERYPLAVPRQLQLDLLRSSERLGLIDENRQYQRAFAITHWPTSEQFRQQGELVLLFHNGLAPFKVERAVTVPVPPRGQFVRVALPEYQRREAGFSGARLLVAERVVKTEPVANIEELAIAELAANRPAILARAATRSIMKYQLSREAGKQNGLAGLLVNIVGLLTEQADTRSWMSLPAQIQMGRISLPAGEYDVTVELLDMTGQVASRLSYPAVVLPAGEKTFLSIHGIAETSLRGRH